MKKRFLMCVVLCLGLFAGCGSKKTDGVEPVIVTEEKYNVAIVKTGINVQRPAEGVTDAIMENYENIKDGKTLRLSDGETATVFLIKGYRCFSNGFIEVIAKDGHKFMTSADNIILMFEPDIKE